MVLFRQSVLEVRVKELEEERDAGLEVLRRVVSTFKAETFFLDYSEEDNIGQIGKALFDGIKEVLTQSLKDRMSELHKMGRDRISVEKKVKQHAERIAKLEKELRSVADSLEDATKDNTTMGEDWAEHIREVLG